MELDCPLAGTVTSVNSKLTSETERTSGLKASKSGTAEELIRNKQETE